MSEKLTREQIERQKVAIRHYLDGDDLLSDLDLTDCLAALETALASLEPSAEREAGFAEGIEAAAKVCDGLADGRRHVPIEGKKEQYQRASQDCARTVRALSQPSATGDANG